MLKYLDEAKTLISFSDPEGETVVIVEKGDARFDELADQKPEDFAGISEAERLEAERAAMVVSRFQAKAALYQSGLLAGIEALLAGADSFIHRLAWDESTEFHRDSPTLNFLAKAAGLSESDLDDLFRLAMTIRA